MKCIQSVAVALAAFVALGAGSASAESPRARMFAEAQAAGDRGAVAQIERDGTFSAATVSQFAGSNTARQYARGARGARSSGNSGAIIQNGANNGAYVRQVGTGLGVGVVQNNNNNRAYVLQMGHDLGLGITQNGGARTVVVQTQDRIVARDVR